MSRKIIHLITANRVWRSIFRYGYPDTEENRSKVIFQTFFLHIHPVKVKTHTLKPTYTFGLGVIAFYLFAVLTITGVLLMFFYVPSVQRAYTDIQALETAVPFGMLMRNVHRWGAHLMVLFVFLHMMRVFYTGGYKYPRELNWVIGVLLWVFTLLLSFTGYLLPWDQLSFWAITVGTNIAGAAPVIGEEARTLLLGAKEVGQDALLRFYVLHVMLLPLVATVFILIHFWRIRKDGGISSPAEQNLPVP
ncbi:MAG: cytochrome b N-terminal domain-containing protein [Chloroflexi bacterium]|nr:cytochrome b N-terminal domain-containing protein [Chloroflexota bacterium]